MKIILSILLLTLIQLDETNGGEFVPHFTPKFFATLLDFYPDGVNDDKSILYGTLIQQSMKEMLKVPDKNKANKADITLHLQIMQNVFNNIYEHVKAFKSNIQSKYPSIDEVLKVSKRGFLCDRKFCEKFGDGHHAMGICTPYLCECNIFGAEGNKCLDGFYYDPVYKTCDYPTNIRICGI